MKKNIIAVILTIALIVTFFSIQQAWATWTLYDDFPGNSINPSNWYNLSGDPTSVGFSVSVNGGNLVLSGNGGTDPYYSSPTGNLFATTTSGINGAYISYSGFRSTNAGNIPAAVCLIYGYFDNDSNKDDYFEIARGTVAGENVLVALYTGGAIIGMLPYSGDSGVMGILRSGTGINFIYSDNPNASPADWLSLGKVSDVGNINYNTLLIQAMAGSNGTMTANVGAVYVNSVSSVPEPASMLLLGVGLIGLSGVRRKFKK